MQKLQHKVNWTIDANKWEILCEHPDPAVVPLVREFYANGKERDEFRVFVREKWVKFDRTTINNYYGLQTYKMINTKTYWRVKRPSGKRSRMPCAKSL